MRDKKLLLAFLLPVVILISMTVVPVLTIFYGQEVLLETEPYDPRDLFRGDYVTLNYNINHIAVSQLDPQLRNQITRNQHRLPKKLYALLELSDGYYVIEQITNQKPGKDRLYLNCRIPNGYYFDNNSYQIFVEYNLDRYFVPENTGKDLESMSREGQLVAKVKIFNGYPLLLEVFPKKI